MKNAEVAKVYAIKDEPSTSKKDKGKGVLEGNIFIKDKWFRVLFDAGASHSFISNETVEKLELKTQVNEDPICVSYPIGVLPLFAYLVWRFLFSILAITFLMT